jgi:hypothetical protein
MRVRTFADLVLRGSVASVTRARAALNKGCPDAMDACKQIGIPPSTLAEAIVDALPDALNVGIAEKVRGQWWPKQKAGKPVPASLKLETIARLEHLVDGSPAVTLWVRCTVQLDQEDAWVEEDSASSTQGRSDRGLRLGDLRAWNAKWQLELSQEAPTVATAGAARPGACRFVHTRRGSATGSGGAVRLKARKLLRSQQRSAIAAGGPTNWTRWCEGRCQVHLPQQIRTP